MGPRAVRLGALIASLLILAGCGASDIGTADVKGKEADIQRATQRLPGPIDRTDRGQR